MRQEPGDDELVPPIKVLRRRLNGVYRADGFRGPTRRYVLIVAMLVGLASLPTLAAITAGSHELDDGSTGAMDVPFLPPPSSGPIIPLEPEPSAPASPTSPPRTVPARPQVSKPPPAGAGPSQAMPEKPKPGYAKPSAARPVFPEKLQNHQDEWSRPVDPRPGTRPGSKPAGTTKPSRNVKPKPGSTAQPKPRPGKPKPGRPKPGKPRPGGVPQRPGTPGKPIGQRPSIPVRPVKPPGPDAPPFRPGQPPCHDRGKCGARPDHHHRPDFSRHRQCDRAAHRAKWSHQREGRARAITVRKHDQHRKHRSEHRSPSSEESAVSERSHNVRPARSIERTHNSRRHHVTDARSDEPQSGGRSYRGHHRAEPKHSGESQGEDTRAITHHGRHHGGHRY